MPDIRLSSSVSEFLWADQRFVYYDDAGEHRGEIASTSVPFVYEIDLGVQQVNRSIRVELRLRDGRTDNVGSNDFGGDVSARMERRLGWLELVPNPSPPIHVPPAINNVHTPMPLDITAKSTGDLRADLYLETSGSNVPSINSGGQISVMVRGGTNVNEPQLRLCDVSQLSLFSAPVNCPLGRDTKHLCIKNIGRVNLNIDSLSAIDPLTLDASPIYTVEPAFPVVISPGDTRAWEVHFAPTKVGIDMPGAIVITSNAPTGSVELHGVGHPTILPSIVVQPSPELTFVLPARSRQARNTITVWNISPCNPVSDLSLRTSGHPFFLVEHLANASVGTTKLLHQSVPAGSSREFEVLFVETATREARGLLEVSTPPRQIGPVTIQLVGINPFVGPERR